VCGAWCDRHNSSAGLKGKGDKADDKADDKGDKLPPGWTRKESKSQKGRYYYIGPDGKTQWVPPVVKASKRTCGRLWIRDWRRD
jgi:hypothetical protein